MPYAFTGTEYIIYITTWLLLHTEWNAVKSAWSLDLFKKLVWVWSGIWNQYKRKCVDSSSRNLLNVNHFHYLRIRLGRLEFELTNQDASGESGGGEGGEKIHRLDVNVCRTGKALKSGNFSHWRRLWIVLKPISDCKSEKSFLKCFVSKSLF